MTDSLPENSSESARLVTKPTTARTVLERRKSSPQVQKRQT